MKPQICDFTNLFFWQQFKIIVYIYVFCSNSSGLFIYIEPASAKNSFTVVAPYSVILFGLALYKFEKSKSDNQFAPSPLEKSYKCHNSCVIVNTILYSVMRSSVLVLLINKCTLLSDVFAPPTDDSPPSLSSTQS